MSKNEYNQKRKKEFSLKTIPKNQPILIDYSEVVDIVKEAAETNEVARDYGFNYMLDIDDAKLAKFIEDNYEPTFIYNSLNTDLSLGILLGLISQDYTAYEQNEATYSDENFDGEMHKKPGLIYGPEDLD